jgi:hypothetical protein
MRKLFEKRGGTDDLATADTHLQLHAHDIRSAHATCSCYPKDVADLTGQNEEPQDTPPPAIYVPVSGFDTMPMLWVVLWMLGTIMWHVCDCPGGSGDSTTFGQETAPR